MLSSCTLVQYPPYACRSDASYIQDISPTDDALGKKKRRGGEIWLQAPGCTLWLCTNCCSGLGSAASRDISDWYHELCMRWETSCLALLIFSQCPLLTGEAETSKSILSAGFRSAGSFLGGRDPLLEIHSQSPQNTACCLDRASRLDKDRTHVQVHTQCFESRNNLFQVTSFDSSSGGDCFNIKLSHYLPTESRGHQTTDSET